MNKIYFPNLNGIRFIAAFLVILHHVEQLKNIFGFENYWANPFINTVGKLGVILFFVLSGFLITYLLLAEEEQTKNISIQDFYLRRIFRIWPLYYLIVFLSFFVFPYVPFLNLGEWTLTLFEHTAVKFALFFFFLPNLATVVFQAVPYASQAWSVGVEEQFYLIWPVIIKKFKNKELLLYGVILGYLVVKVGLFKINELTGSNLYLTIALRLWNTFSIDCMAIGGVFALYLYRGYALLKLLYNQYLQWVVLCTLLILISLGVNIPFIHYEFYAILFGILILNLSSNPNSVVSLEYRLLNYLGKISYGLYMFHVLGIVITLKALNFIGVTNLIIQYTLSIMISVLLAGISYKYIERRFILKKAKFTKIITGDSVVSKEKSGVQINE
jgi:peptidoglycan/LPS O-acetylase OafA/YrhL